MAKQINFEYDGKEYCLEYTRETVKQMEREGFKSSDVIDKPMLSLPRLFAGAFKAHHKWGVKPDTIEKIFNSFTNEQVNDKCTLPPSCSIATTLAASSTIPENIYY